MTDLLERLRTVLHDLLHWVEGFAANPYGGWILFVLAFAESSFFPIPPDVLLIPLCLGDPDKAFWFAFLCSLGSVLGGLAGYGIGYVGGRPLLVRLFSQERLEAVGSYFDRFNAWAIGIAGFTPVPYKVFTLSAGAFAINLRIFLIASVISRSLRFFLVAGLIWAFGEPIQAFIDEYLGLLTLAVAVLAVGGFWIAGRGVRRAGKGERTPTEAVPEDAP